MIHGTLSRQSTPLLETFEETRGGAAGCADLGCSSKHSNEFILAIFSRFKTHKALRIVVEKVSL